MDVKKLKVKGTTYDIVDNGLEALKVSGNANKTITINNDGTAFTVADKADVASPAFSGTPTAPTAALGTDTTQIATTAFVKAEVNDKIAESNAMIYKGTIGVGGTVTELPSTTAKVGWTYKVITAGTYGGHTCEIGDMLICHTKGSTTTAATWDAIQGNVDGAVIGPTSAVDNQVAVFSGTTGRLVKDSGFTIAKSVPSDAVFTDTTYEVATTESNGLMTTTMVSKLAGIAEGATANTIVQRTGTSATDLMSQKAVTDELATKQANLPTTTTAGYILKATDTAGTVIWGAEYSYTLPATTTTSLGGIILGGGTANYLRADGTWVTPPDTITTATESGSGNGVAAVTAENGALTITKATFLNSDSGLNAAKLTGTVPAGCYTNTVTTATDSGSGNGVASVTASNGALTITKADFLNASSSLNAAKLTGTVPTSCYTNTVTTASDSGTGNGVTAVTASNGALTISKTTFATPTGTNYNCAEVVYNNGSSGTITLSNGRIFYTTASAITLPAVSNGVTITIIGTQSSYTWSGDIVWSGGSAPSINSGSYQVFTFCGITSPVSKWYGVYGGAFS